MTDLHMTTNGPSLFPAVFSNLRRLDSINNYFIMEDIQAGFQAVNVSVKQEVLDKCCELCATYNIDPEDFIDQWLAYTASNLSGAPPSLDALDKMERRELQKLARSITKTPKANQRKSLDIELATPPRKPKIQEQSPRITQINTTPKYDTPSKQFSERSDARSVQCSWGAEASFKNPSMNPLRIKILNEDIKTSKYMYEKLLVRQQALNEIARWIIEDTILEHQLELTLEHIKEYSGEMVICGRVYSEGAGKMDPQSIIFEGTLGTYKGQTIKLILDNVDHFALFNGQAIVIKGNNMKNRFMVNQVYTGAPLLSPQCELKERLEIVVASGPFTFPDNLLYEPLEDLLKYVVESKPNLLILLGPFVEASHPILETANESYDSFFENIVNSIMEQLEGSDVKVALVPSHKDVHNHPIFPSIPFRVKKKHANLILAPNPCLLDIEGLLIGCSSADILFHISKSEVFKDDNRTDCKDRMTRLASHLLLQRSFYPLHPPDDDVKIDYQLLEKFGMMDNAPHLLFLPSNFRRFVKKVDNCLVVNPERLSKGQIAGTFARVEIRPGEASIDERTTIQVLRV